MRFSSTWTLLQFLPLISCNPLPNSPSPRDMPLTFCANAPGTLAGTFFNPSSTPPSTLPLISAPNAPTPWCAALSKTYILITHPATTPPNAQTVSAIQSVLSNAYAVTVAAIHAHGDGPAPADSRGVVFDSVGQRGVQLLVQNANGQALSRGVLGAAIAALRDWMGEEGWVGGVGFEIVDGTKKVGVGRVQ